VEGSLGVTTASVLDDDSLYVGVFLPCLLVGTVGGGTSLPTQKEALSILGLFSPHSRLEQEQSKFRQSSTDSKFYEDEGQGKVEEFAGIIAAACLAGEISLVSSLSEGSLARAHERLGRSKLKIRK
jgi:hydroxymethylglutaryl-CoA reductase (NADPH)